MSKTIHILVGLSLGALTLTVVSVLIASALFVQRGAQAATESATVADASSASDRRAVSSTELTSAEVSGHNTMTNCWMVIANNVYNFTTFLNAHPGGSITMTPFCGKEATAAFNTKDKKPASKHTSSASNMLAQYFVGALGSRIASVAPVSGASSGSSIPTPAKSGMSSLLSSIGNTANSLLTGAKSTITSTSTTLTTANIATHGTSSNCWIIVSAVAYDVTGYLVQHPGGVGTITPYCGRDATNAFVTKGKGSSHSSFAYQQLTMYKIGNIGSTVTSTAVIGGSAFLPTSTPTPTLALGQSPTPTPTPLPVAQSGYSTSQVSSHNTNANCWIIVSNKAYNVTSYLVDHPGGVDVITPYCGMESTNAFATKGYGSNHSNSAYAQLNNYFIGDIITSGAVATPTPTPSPSPTPLPPTPTPTNNPGQTPTPTPTPISASPTPTPTPQSTTGYTAAEVAAHNTSSNCWLSISNKVYSLASYLTKHPGGVSVITKYCGKEATNAFATKDGRNNNHSTSAYNQLAPYFIGNLVTATQPTATPTPTPIPATSTPTKTPTPIPATSTPTKTPTPIPATSTPTKTPTPTTAAGYTAAQVATHNTSANCWIIVSAKVYNLTTYMTQHPGGVGTITPYCGKEATNAFATKGGRGSNHSSNAYTKLNAYFIGNLL